MKDWLMLLLLLANLCALFAFERATRTERDAAVRAAFWCGMAESGALLKPGSVSGDIRRVCARPRTIAEADRFIGGDVRP